MFDEKIAAIKRKFSSLSPTEKYQLLMEWGKNLAALPPEQLIEANEVRGCQSKLYLYSEFREGKIFFFSQSDALISAGLAALLIQAYNGESPETLLKRPPDFLHELGISTSLSPSRSNGLLHIHLRMKQDALKFLIHTSKSPT